MTSSDGRSMTFEEWEANQRALSALTLEKKIERGKAMIRIYGLLLRSGYNVPSEIISNYFLSYGITVDIEISDLPDLRERFGQLETTSTEIKNAEDNTVWVWVAPKDESWPPIRFRYTRALTDGDRCKIKQYQPEPYMALVCEN